MSSQHQHRSHTRPKPHKTQPVKLESMNYPMSDLPDRAIGDIIRDTKNLSPEQVELVLEYQRQHNVKFGEACVELGLARRQDVIWALSQQFHYPYAGGMQGRLSNELTVANDPFSPDAETFRDLRSQLISNLAAPGEPKRALAILSNDVGDGKSYFAANLAVAFSQLGSRTLLIDADLRTPRQHAIFNVEGNNGLSGVLSGRQETNVIRPSDYLPTLYLLPVGTTPPNPLELVQRPVFEALLGELLGKFDYVIVDTPAVAHGADAGVIAAKCGASLAIARKNVSRHDQLKKLVQKLSRKPSKFFGVVLNNR